MATDTTPQDTPFTCYYTLSTFDYDGSQMQIALHNQDLAADVINMPMHGGGFMHERGRWIFDYFGSGGGQQTVRKDRPVEAGGGSGGFSIGYGFTFFGLVRVYPFAGVGGYGMGVVMGPELAAPTATTPEIPTAETPNDGEATLLETGGPQGHVGVGIELRLGWRWGLVVGTRLGYHYLFSDGGVSRVPFMRLLAGCGRLR